MTENFWIHPGIMLIAAGCATAMLPRRWRNPILLLGSICAAVSATFLPCGFEATVPFIGDWSLAILHVDRLSFLFAFTFSVMAVIGSLYAFHHDKRLECLTCMVYAGSTVSMILAGDWITLIFFWELMAASSMYLIYCGGQPHSRQAGLRYIIMHLFGGNLLLIGILFLLDGGSAVTSLGPEDGAAFWLIFLGVAVNGVIPPLHTWAADAYPQSSPVGGVFLSCFTTKAAVYVMIRLFAGIDMLIWIGVFMALYGAVYAIMENDARKLLSYHIVSQLGFMVAGIGMGTELGIAGASAHAVCNVLQKSLLFMCMGAVLYATGKRNITQMGGLGKRMPLVFLCFLAGAFAISGVPPFNGFISKSITISAAAQEGLVWTELLLTLASIGTFLSIVLKMGYFIFLAPPEQKSEQESAVRPLPFGMKAAMSVTALLCLITGLFPDRLYGLLPEHIVYAPYTADHLTQSVLLLLAAAVPFLVYLPHMKPSSGISLDFDWFYRKPLKKGLLFLSELCCRIQDAAGRSVVRGIHGCRPFLANPVRWFFTAVDGSDHEEYEEDLYRLPISNPIILIILMLSVLILCLAIFI